MHFTNLGGNSVKRASRNTLQAHTTLDSASVGGAGGVDPRLAMYNKETIKKHLEKREKRRAVSNIRPRQRFSTITAFHKNDVATISNQQEEGINSAGSKCLSYPFLQQLGHANVGMSFSCDENFISAYNEAICIATVISCGQI